MNTGGHCIVDALNKVPTTAGDAATLLQPLFDMLNVELERSIGLLYEENSRLLVRQMFIGCIRVRYDAQGAGATTVSLDG